MSADQLAGFAILCGLLAGVLGLHGLLLLVTGSWS